MKRPAVKPIQMTPEQATDIEAAVFSLVEKLLDPQFFLLDVAFEKESGYWYLRIYLEEKEGSISLSVCETFSRSIDALIDELPQLKDIPYYLEVSSPGLFRPLKRQREFDFYLGSVVRVVSETAPAKKGKKAESAPESLTSIAVPEQIGILQSYNGDTHCITLKDLQKNETFEVPLGQNQMVYLNPEIRFPEEEAVEQEI